MFRFRAFLIGNALFTFTSFYEFGLGIGPLIAFRAMQAMGARMTIALAPAIITSVFPAQERDGRWDEWDDCGIGASHGGRAGEYCWICGDGAQFF